MIPAHQHYDDGLIQLDREALTLRRYHFPSGTAKVIPLAAIRGYRAKPLGQFVHRFRLWGSSDLRRWLPLDVRRPLKHTLITIDVPDAKLRPAFTPTDPDRFIDLLESLLDPNRGHGSD